VASDSLGREVLLAVVTDHQILYFILFLKDKALIFLPFNHASIHRSHLGDVLEQLSSLRTLAVNLLLKLFNPLDEDVC
jgi:hypothetical protein